MGNANGNGTSRDSGLGAFAELAKHMNTARILQQISNATNLMAFCAMIATAVFCYSSCAP